MSELKQKKHSPLFFYLGILQLGTSLFAATIALLFIKYADRKMYDLILGFLPDVSLMTWSVVGIMMLGLQALGNFAGALISFLRWDPAKRLAVLISCAEIIWMLIQYFYLHIHNILMLFFIVFALGQLILVYLINLNNDELTTEE